MNLIFTNEDYKAFWRERQEANKDCYICPCCGEWRQAFAYDLIGENLYLNRQGIDIRTERRQFYDIDKDEFQTASVDCFFCNNCKARWESEPFDYNDDDYLGDVTYDDEDIGLDDGEFVFLDCD